MRISDWSSDVCSSDLDHRLAGDRIVEAATRATLGEHHPDAAQLMKVIDLTPRIGSEIKTDLGALLSGRDAEQIRATLEQRGVEYFRGLSITDEKQRSEEHTSELQPLMRISYAVFCLKKKIERKTITDRRCST